MTAKRNINLDLIRVFAAFMVLSVHIGQYTGREFVVGAKGVQLFFVISGYLAFASCGYRYGNTRRSSGRSS